ncbi:P-loop containing nucleoside triphosphate hydrolase protein [Stachybotrys elegans]|uniref:ATP-dependent RNA helicase n=1 Tax=Stachybotrys elegans TaxID=80388 RepID=A0A8K0WS20_9HYPO|nr:P-loop containing nucleoside triphosphate hydrolase protein [Stachybotrys elegans]
MADDNVDDKTVKRKREKKKAPGSVEPEVEEEEEDSRHKAVLERKAKSLKLAEAIRDTKEPSPEAEEEESHGLEPLPQPEQTAPDTSKPSYDTLPSWLSSPIRVPQETKVPFTELGILPKAARVLEEKGYKEAFAVQTAAIPLLLPSSKHRAGDLLISAATGSGKTLAYALPVVRDLSQGQVTRLRALVVLPTRELVKQAQEVFELCAKAFEGGEHPRLGRWKGEVVDFTSKVDVLICTPGRLVEHMEQTPGFNLDYVRWLVVDEADKLLAQSFQGWLEIVMDRFRVTKFGARDFPDMALSGVRKVILSATLTRDLSLLGQLSLRRPQLIVLDRDDDARVAEHTLPATLREFAVRVHDANLKPLYLLDLLRSSDMSSGPADVPVALIFTKSNESALRLSRLLTLLDVSLSSHISTLTSTTPSHIRRKTLRAFTTPDSPVRLIIASDLVARGIDLPKLDHVVNYDLPPSVAGYVHRVGRTARAGRSGSAWTLVADDESGWFWGKIAKGSGVRRAQKVERTRIEEMAEDRVELYEAALEKLGREAHDMRRR